MSRFSDQVRDEFGREVPNVSVYVYEWDAPSASTGALSALTDDDLSTALPNPLTTDEFGEFYFNWSSGSILLEFHYGGKLQYREEVRENATDLALRTDLATSGGSALVEYGGSTVKANLDAINPPILNIGTKDEGALPAGVSTPFVISKTATANAGGTTDWRALTEVATLTGANGAAQINGHNSQHRLLHSAGTVTAAVGWQGYSTVGVESVATTTGAVGTLEGIQYHISHTGSGAITNAFVFSSRAFDLDTGTGTVAKAHSYHSDDISGGTASNRITTESFGFFQANSSLVNTPIMAAFGSEMSDNSDGKRWSLYLTGGAPNFLAGFVKLGGSGVPAERLDITGNALISGSIKYGGGTALTKAVVYTPSITPASVAADTVAEQTFTVTGLTTADKVIVNPPAIANATGIAGARASASDTLAIRFVNPTAGALTPTSGTYTVLAFRS